MFAPDLSRLLKLPLSLVPSVPMMMRHRPPGSLPLRAIGETSTWSCPYDSQRYCVRRWRRNRGRLQADAGFFATGGITGICGPATPAGDIHCGRQGADSGRDRPRWAWGLRRYPSARGAAFVGSDQLAPPTRRQCLFLCPFVPMRPSSAAPSACRPVRWRPSTPL